METSEKFKNSPMHNKRAIIELMDELQPEQMVKVVDLMQSQVKLSTTREVIYCTCKDRTTFYRDKEDNDVCYDCDLMIKQ